MTFTSLLIHRCTIERAEFAQDAYGEEAAVSWKELHKDQPCRLVMSSESPATGGSLQMQTTYQLILPGALEVTTKDRIEKVVLEDGSKVGPFDINAVIQRRDARRGRLMSLSLDRVKGIE